MTTKTVVAVEQWTHRALSSIVQRDESDAALAVAVGRYCADKDAAGISTSIWHGFAALMMVPCHCAPCFDAGGGVFADWARAVKSLAGKAVL